MLGDFHTLKCFHRSRTPWQRLREAGQRLCGAREKSLASLLVAPALEAAAKPAAGVAGAGKATVGREFRGRKVAPAPRAPAYSAPSREYLAPASCCVTLGSASPVSICRTGLPSELL